jgi:hypothetical protein
MLKKEDPSGYGPKRDNAGLPKAFTGRGEIHENLNLHKERKLYAL